MHGKRVWGSHFGAPCGGSHKNMDNIVAEIIAQSQNAGQVVTVM